MVWDFSTEPQFQERLDWADRFVRDAFERLYVVLPGLHHTRPNERTRRIVDALKARVIAHEPWATHLGPELGGRGFGQLKLALLTEIPGRSWRAPRIFGTQAPDTGNAEILAHYGTEPQEDRFLAPLLEGEVFFCCSMTGPQGGSEPTQATSRAWPGAEGPAPDVLADDRRGQFLAPRFPVGS